MLVRGVRGVRERRQPLDTKRQGENVVPLVLPHIAVDKRWPEGLSLHHGGVRCG